MRVFLRYKGKFANPQSEQQHKTITRLWREKIFLIWIKQNTQRAAKSNRFWLSVKRNYIILKLFYRSVHSDFYVISICRYINNKMKNKPKYINYITRLYIDKNKNNTTNKQTTTTHLK